jgi:CubicO group peptidase (beta-lactamase class C family)
VTAPSPSSASLRRRIEARLGEAGYAPQEPMVVAMRKPELGEIVINHGCTTAALPLRADTVAYAASLSKQVTAACLALLVERGAVTLESTLAEWLPELPDWATSVRVRHLVHHTAALPADADIDAAATRGGLDRTTGGVIASLASTLRLAHEPGTRFAYSNAGYVCLAVLIQRAAGQPLPHFADEHLFEPIGMSRTCFWPGPGPAPREASPLTPQRPAPLSLGDGGLWSTADDLLRWARCLNNDELGISQLLQTPGHLDDQTPLDYAWGTGIRAHSGNRLYRHGGAWANLRVMLTRAPELDLSLVSIATADDTERRVVLTNGLLDLLIG